MSQIQIFINKKLEEGGITQRELAQKANISAPIISNISNGHKSNVAINTLYKLANALDCSIDEVCGRKALYSPTNPSFTPLTTEAITSNLKSFLEEKMSQHGNNTRWLEKEANLGLGSIASFMKASSNHRSLNSAIVISIADYFKVSIDEMIGRIPHTRQRTQNVEVQTAQLPNDQPKIADMPEVLKKLANQDAEVIKNIKAELESYKAQNINSSRYKTTTPPTKTEKPSHTR